MRDHFPCLSRLLLLACATMLARPGIGQTVRVDISPARAVMFDPDQAMGSSIDILSAKEFETVYSAPILKESLSAGWGPITYRQNTELTIDAWHWNPNGKWSDVENKSGYFVGSAEPGEMLRQSFGYKLPHRGSTRSDAGQNEYSRIVDGDAASYWKSNPYLTAKIYGRAGQRASTMGGD